MRLTTKSILLILVVFLLGTNVAVIVTHRQHLKSEQIDQPNKIEVPDTQLGRFFKDQLNLDANQQRQFRVFRRTYNRNANQVFTDMQLIRNEMVLVLKSPHPDRDRLDHLAERLGEKHMALKVLTFDYYFSMQNVLQPEQQEKMVDIFQSMLADEGYAKTPCSKRGMQNRKGGNSSLNNDSLRRNQN
ncbi:MAG: periplasmic heavy metal sensor [Prolixibacteraceae bacterium]|jgi:Spy/CpxP family protein refolding chaperone|nr:periplasmic heavy metal sensor [Prolixibacteraceae bacterium]